MITRVVFHGVGTKEDDYYLLFIKHTYIYLLNLKIGQIFEQHFESFNLFFFF